MLFGRAIESDPERPDAVTSIERSRTSEVAERTQSWAGRWLLANPSNFYPDAAGLLGCFYLKDTEGGLWVSSSPALIAQHAFATQPTVIDGRKLVYERGISWFPPPLSRLDGVQRLLPSQTLDLATGTPAPRSLMPPIEMSSDEDALIAWLTQTLRTVMSRLADAAEEPPWLGLTAGFDSRLMLAIAVSADLEVRPYTRLTERMPVADRVLPPRIAKRAGVQHWIRHEITSRSAMEERRGLLERHAGGHVSDGDARPYLTGARDGMDGVTFGGHGFAIAGGFNDWREFPEEMPEPEEAAALLMRSMGEPRGSSAAKGLTEWFAWVKDHPHPNLDWRDRVFLEQRQAGWLASKEQLFDMNRLERFPILNAATIYARILGLSAARRTGSSLQRRMIESLRSDLATIPFNPSDRMFLARYPHLVLRRRYRRLVKKAVQPLRRGAAARPA
ncbi:hypothetical protein [Algihabitans albus]|uniref:hypothetical protein n=1 Tax=Algihabitans albus TaxID=2164067 RepID=UPI000E5D3EF7|nr:hypothetical protein [Algihabitans albus]